MKTANVVSVRDRDLCHDAPEQAGQARIDRMSRLLRLYPAIEEDERQQLLAFLTAGPQDEIVQVTQLLGLEPRFHAFRKDHPAAFPVGIRSWLPLILFVMIAVVGVAWRLLH